MVRVRFFSTESLKANVFVCLVMGAALPSASAVVLYENDFEDDSVGTYTVANLTADWNSPSGNNGVDEGRVSIADDADAYGAKSLVVTYPEGESNQGKSQWRLDLKGGYEELFLSYRIRFDEGFDFVRGGKLPGLCGGACNTGGNAPTGTDGWSARMMWRTDGSGGAPTNGDTANIVQYAYHVDQPTQFGEDLRWDDGTPPVWREFESDTWYHLQHRIVMNTPGAPDGIIQAWLDGEMVLDVQDIRFRDTNAFQIDTMYFSTFFGGSSTIWEATKDEQVYLDDFVVSTEYLHAGDYNRDGVVDAADYTVWRDAYGSTTLLAADGDGNGIIGDGDRSIWRDAFGNSPPAAAQSVPEPSTAVLLLTTIFASLRATTRVA